MLSNFDQGIHPEAQHTGFYNDPDMMVIGMPGLNDAENRAHMALWAISGAPLLVGADLTTLSNATLATLTNPGVLAIDQDALGLQAVKVAEEAGGLEIWSKRLSGSGERAVLMLNRSDAGASIAVSPITVNWKDLGLAGSAATVRDPWTGKELGTFSGHYSATVQHDDAVLLVVRGKDAESTRVLPADSTKDKTAALQNEQRFRFTGPPCDEPIEAVQISYKNPSASARFAEVRTNGQIPTRIAFPPTGTGAGTVWVQVPVDRGEAGTSGNNLLRFSSSSGQVPQIDWISLNPNRLCSEVSARTP
jgi:hypothetical protein